MWDEGLLMTDMGWGIRDKRLGFMDEICGIRDYRAKGREMMDGGKTHVLTDFGSEFRILCKIYFPYN